MASIAGGVTASYTYDYQGRRTSKTTGGTTTSYLYEGLNLVRTGGASQADYLFGPGIDEPLAIHRNESISYYSVDGLGSAVLLNDPTGTVQNAYHLRCVGRGQGPERHPGERLRVHGAGVWRGGDVVLPNTVLPGGNWEVRE
ncbi:MAG TPA: hypothetical protein PLS53_11715 [Thermoanaerobaculaceae bacterium]|nr:hypothetical protein [Thermoanaerobaculaceae bacterium]